MTRAAPLSVLAALVLAVAAADARAHGGTHPTPFPTGTPSSPSTPGGGSPAFTNSIRSTRWEDWWDLHRWRFLRIDRKSPLLTGPGARAPFIETEAGKFLLEALKDSWWDTRAAACIALGKAADPEDQKHLRPRVFDEREETRGAAMLGLGLLHADLRAVEVLRVLDDAKEQARLRAFAALALGLSRDAAAVIPLARRLLDPRDVDEVRAAAALALGPLGDLSGIPHLRRVLDNPNQPEVVRAMAVTALGRLCAAGYERRAAGGDDGWSDATDAAGRAAAALLDPDYVREVLLRVLRADRSDGVRRAAVLAVGRLGKREDVPALIRAIDDPDYGVEILAMVTVGEAAKGSAFTDQILRVLTGRATTAKYPGTRAFAALGLGLLGDRRAGPTLVQVLDHGKHNTLRAAGAIALGLLGSAEGERPLLAVASSRGDPELRGHAIVALGMLRCDTAWLAFRELLKTDSTPAAVRGAAAEALALAGQTQDLESLAKLLAESRSAWLRMSTIQALGYLRDDAALRHLIAHFRRETDDEVRAMVVVAVGNIVARTLPHAFQDLARDVNYLLHAPGIEQAIRLR